MLTREDYKKEIEPLLTPIQKGENTERVKRVQEWLNLHRYYTPKFKVSIQIDGGKPNGGFGLATESAIKAFQLASGLEQTGAVDQITWMALTAPMQRAFKEIKFEGAHTIQDRFIAYVDQFLAEHPVEIQPNHGPWVRAFMKGKEWDDAAWCNGVLSTALDHASASMSVEMGIYMPWTWSVPESMNYAKSKAYKCEWFNQDWVKTNYSLIKPGDMGVVMGSKGPQHIFAVRKMEASVMHTGEGNSNDEGSREGYEMCEGRRDATSGKYGIIKFK